MKLERKRRNLITFIVLTIAIAGYLVYQYGYLAYREYDYYAYYDNVHGLQRSCPVMINGVRVGEVNNIELNGNNKVKVALAIDKKTPVPKGSIAMLASRGLLGEMVIHLQQGAGPGIYTHNDVLTGMYDTSVMDMKDQIDPMIESAQYILNTADRTFSNFNRRVDNGLVKKTQNNIRSIERSMDAYKKQVSSLHLNADRVLDDLHKYKKQTDEIVANSSKLDSNIKNAESSTAKLANEPFAATTSNLRNTVSDVKKQANDLEESDVVNNALNKKKEYNAATTQLKGIDSNARQLQRNPPGFSLLGGD